MSFKIICIDGGGVRGIYPAHILHRIEEEFHIKINQHFDMIVGTSTGSIIAGAVAANYSLRDIVRIFEEKSKDIFKRKRFFGYSGAIKSRYDKKVLTEILELALGSKTLSETELRLVIPATDIINGNVHVFKSNYLNEFVRDKHVKISDAILASCSAPTYFDPQKVGSANYLLADGGLWANNPSMVALTEAIGKLGMDKSDVKILSVGTGFNHIRYQIDFNSRKWGLFTGWGGKKLFETILNLQVLNDMNRAKLILRDNYLRINYETEKELPLDRYNIVEEMKNRADYTFTHNAEKIRQFLEINQGDTQ